MPERNIRTLSSCFHGVENKESFVAQRVMELLLVGGVRLCSLQADVFAHADLGVSDVDDYNNAAANKDDNHHRYNFTTLTCM